MTEIQALAAADVARALAEDIGPGDLTASLIAATTNGAATIISREHAVLCGQAWFDQAFSQLDATTSVRWLCAEGAAVEPNQTLCEVRGNARALLSAERTALNFLQLLSGTATLVRSYVQEVRGTRAKIVDTRKTLPGLRRAQKYAVTAGGGTNHRIGLFDGILIKENHIMAAGGIRPAMERALQLAPAGVPVQIEVENLADLELAIAAGAKLILLDNFALPALKQAVELAGTRAELEASGGIDLANVRAVAQTGVHRISIGALTKNARAVDLSMRFKQ
jgi:nicotinate-nucleotide pyrophosphorylase (carboxylating)